MSHKVIKQQRGHRWTVGVQTDRLRTPKITGRGDQWRGNYLARQIRK